MDRIQTDPDSIARCRAVALSDARAQRTIWIIRLVTLGTTSDGPALRTVVRALDVLIEKLSRPQ